MLQQFRIEKDKTSGKQKSRQSIGYLRIHFFLDENCLDSFDFQKSKLLL